MAIDVGSTWWIQVFFFIAINGAVYGLIEFWRYFPFIWGYISIILTFGLMPLVVLSDNDLFLKIKYFIISPVLIVLTLWRIVYIPYDENTPKWKVLLIKLAKLSGKYVCCLKQDLVKKEEFEEKNTTSCMEIFFWFVAFINIIVAVITGFMSGVYMNAICGLLLSVTVPIPTLGNYYVEGGNLYDGIAQIHWLWIVTFTVWDWLFVWSSSYGWNSVFLSTIHLLPSCIRSLINKQYKIYLQLRVFCLTIFVWIRLPVNFFDTFPWFLNAANFPFWRNVSNNHRYVYEIIGSLTCGAAIIHCIIFIKDLIALLKKRKANTITNTVQTEMQINETNKYSADNSAA